jgi:hypothetical protein
VDDQTPSIPLPARKQFDLANHATIKILWPRNQFDSMNQESKL